MTFRKLTRSLYFMGYVLCRQRRYRNLRYLLEKGPGESDTLLVSFSGFPGKGPARYNYMNTLKEVPAARLFILDDFGYKKRGAYYLGEQGDWFVPEQVVALIQMVAQKVGARKIITLGSSKGGTAALYYGIRCGAEKCIIGAPQYRLGDYLNTPNHLPILQGIMGSTDQQAVDALNRVVEECIASGTDPKPRVHIHYSPLEHTYPGQIEPMLRHLRENGYAVAEDANYTYTSHAAVAEHFPRYLLQVLKEL